MSCPRPEQQIGIAEATQLCSGDEQVRLDLVPVVDPPLEDQKAALGGTRQGLAIEFILGKDGMKRTAEAGTP